MNHEAKPLLKLTKSELQFWPLLIERSIQAWNETDNFMASQMCRDFATVEELARVDFADSLLQSICVRLHEGARLLKLDCGPGVVKRPSQQRKIIDAILAGT